MAAMLAVLVAFFAVAAGSVRDDSLTIDETAHIVSGYAALKFGDFNLNLEHPPLMKVIAAIPLLSMSIAYQPSTAGLPDQWSEGVKFLFHGGVETDAILWRARLAVIAFNALLLALVGALAWQVFRRKSLAVGLLAFLAFDPNLLAHARYVTTDTPLAYAIAGLVLALILITKGDFVKGERDGSTAATAPFGKGGKGGFLLTASLIFLLACCLLVKFSGLLAFVITTIILIVHVRRKAKGRKNGSDRPAFGLLHLTLAICVPLLLTYALYAAVTRTTPPAQLVNLASEVSPANRPLFRDLANWAITKPATAFIIGVAKTANRTDLNQKGSVFPQYLDGEWKSGKGWISYFPKAILYKETPAFLLLFLAALGIAGGMAWRRKKDSIAIRESEKRKHKDGPAAAHSRFPHSIWLVGLFLLAYLIPSLFSPLNIGIRHVAPVLALMPLFAFLVFDRLQTDDRNVRLPFTDWKPKSVTLLSSFIFVLLSSQAFSIATTYPYFLSYFNAPSGGFAKGYLHLADSNLDWGNNLKRLTQWTYAQGIALITVDYWGKSPLNLYDPENRLRPWHVENGRPTGYFAVTPQWITHSQAFPSGSGSTLNYGFLEKLTPMKTFGGGLWVYRLP